MRYQIAAERPEVLEPAPFVKGHMRHGQQRAHCVSIGMNRCRMCNLAARRGRWRQLFDESLFLKALTEGLPMIRPGSVDICRPMMVRYSVI